MATDGNERGARAENAPTDSDDPVFGILGRAAQRSLSPIIHNTAFQAQGRPGRYIAIPAPSSAIDLVDVLNQIEVATKGRLAGLTIAAPYKERALELAVESSEVARKCGGANLLVRCKGGWRADTTDVLGAVVPLERRELDLRGFRSLVVGCGGAGRAAAFGLQRAGADVIMGNRHRPRGELAGRILGLPWTSLDSMNLAHCDLVVNGTSVGRDGHSLPFSVEELAPGAIILDYVYSKSCHTALAQQGRARGHVVIDGREVLVAQVAEQFRRMNGYAMIEAHAWACLGWTPECPRQPTGIDRYR